MVLLGDNFWPCRLIRLFCRSSCRLSMSTARGLSVVCCRFSGHGVDYAAAAATAAAAAAATGAAAAAAFV